MIRFTATGHTGCIYTPFSKREWAQDGYLDFHARNSVFFFEFNWCCFNGPQKPWLIWDREPRTATSTDFHTALSSDSVFKLDECCFTSTETVGLLGPGAQDGHLDFHTTPELWQYLTGTRCLYPSSRHRACSDMILAVSAVSLSGVSISSLSSSVCQGAPTPTPARPFQLPFLSFSVK